MILAYPRITYVKKWKQKTVNRKPIRIMVKKLWYDEKNRLIKAENYEVLEASETVGEKRILEVLL